MEVMNKFFCRLFHHILSNKGWFIADNYWICRQCYTKLDKVKEITKNWDRVSEV